MKSSIEKLCSTFIEKKFTIFGPDLDPKSYRAARHPILTPIESERGRKRIGSHFGVSTANEKVSSCQKKDLTVVGTFLPFTAWRILL